LAGNRDSVRPAAWAALFLVLVAAEAAAWPQFGDVRLEDENGRRVLVLDVQFKPRPDTVRVFVGESGHRLSLRRPGERPPLLEIVTVPGSADSPLAWAGTRDGAHRLVGRLPLGPAGEPPPSFFEIEGWRWQENGRRNSQKGQRFLAPRTLAISANPFVAFGYYAIDAPPTAPRDGFVGSFGGAVDLWWVSERVSLGFDVHVNFSNDEPFTFAEAPRLNWRHHFGGVTDAWRPALDLGGTYSLVDNERGGASHRREELGGSFGAALVGPWESFSYRYDTALGGYHVATIDVLGTSAGTLRGGTRFEYVHGPRFDTVRAALVIEGLGMNMRDLQRPGGERPWWHRALSYASMLPLAVIIAPFALIPTN
jgi:hypothetical protein